MTVDEGMQKLEEDKTVFLSAEVNFWSSSNVHTFLESKLIIGIPFTKNSPLHPIFKSLAAKTNQIGIIPKLRLGFPTRVSPNNKTRV